MFSLFDTEIFVIAVHNMEKFSSHRDRCRIRKHAVLFTLGVRVEGFTFRIGIVQGRACLNVEIDVGPE